MTAALHEPSRREAGAMGRPSPLEALLKQDRRLAIGGLVLVIGLSWTYILAGAGMGMTGLETAGGSGAQTAMPMMRLTAWTPAYAGLMFLMWWIMMMAMMLPSASPTILLYTAIARTSEAAAKGARRGPGPATLMVGFTLGYLVTWAGFSAVATAAQWGLESSGLLSRLLQTTNGALGAGLLVAAGLYQLTPLKQACLRRCRSPVQFISTHWRRGLSGAFRMGAGHGVFCLGCCWFLMVLLFYGGVMNLFWIIGLALFVLLEKLAPFGPWLGRAAGAVLILWGALAFWMFLEAA